jgi:hypothetical protein
VRIRNGQYYYSERHSESRNKSVKLAVDQKFDNFQNLSTTSLLSSCSKTLSVEVYKSMAL